MWRCSVIVLAAGCVSLLCAGCSKPADQQPFPPKFALQVSLQRLCDTDNFDEFLKHSNIVRALAKDIAPLVNAKICDWRQLTAQMPLSNACPIVRCLFSGSTNETQFQLTVLCYVLGEDARPILTQISECMRRADFRHYSEAQRVLMVAAPISLQVIFQYFPRSQQDEFDPDGFFRAVRNFIRGIPEEALPELIRLHRESAGEIKRETEEWLSDAFAQFIPCESMDDVLLSLGPLLDAVDPFAIDLLKAYSSRCAAAAAPSIYE